MNAVNRPSSIKYEVYGIRLKGFRQTGTTNVNYDFLKQEALAHIHGKRFTNQRIAKQWLVDHPFKMQGAEAVYEIFGLKMRTLEHMTMHSIDQMWHLHVLTPTAKLYTEHYPSRDEAFSHIREHTSVGDQVHLTAQLSPPLGLLQQYRQAQENIQ